MKLRTIVRLIKQGFSSILKNRLMVVASLTTVIAALFVFGVFYILLVNIDKNLAELKEQLQIVAYIKGDVDDQHIKEMQEGIKKIPYVTEVNFISSEEGLKRFKSDFAKDEDMKELLDAISQDNPVPATFEIKVNQAEYIGQTSQQIGAMNGIEKTKDGKDITDLLIQASRFIRIIGMLVLSILGFVAIFIISNTIKLTVYVRRFEINIMKYIGATDWFIRWPFIIEGLVIGIVGSTVSIGILWILYYYGLQEISERMPSFVTSLNLEMPKTMMGIIYPYIFSIGIGIGVIGSSISIKKYLRV